MATDNKRALVIVESPTKAVSLAKFLGSGFVVESSRGHVRDLPTGAAEVPAKYKGEKWARTGVNIAADFEPLYVVAADKKGTIRDLKAKLKEVYPNDQATGYHLGQIRGILSVKRPL